MLLEEEEELENSYRYQQEGDNDYPEQPYDKTN